MLKVINLFGGPCSAKSTTASGLFYDMKRSGESVELVTEYAKDMVWEGRSNILEDQLYILAKQNRRLHRLRGVIEWVITDSPLLFGIVYAKSSYYDAFNTMVYAVWNSYENYSFYLPRNPKFTYTTVGRSQSLDELTCVDDAVKQVLPKETITLSTDLEYKDQILTALKLRKESK
jgi:hypothetical protein